MILSRHAHVSSSLLLRAGLGIVVFYWSLLVCFNIGSLLLVHYPAIYLCISTLVSVFILKKISNNKCKFYLLIFIVLLWFAVAIMISSLMMDLTWDGLAYHQPAVIFISDGWNPNNINSLNSFVADVNNKYGGEVGVYPNTIWIASYPKGAWEIASIFISVGFKLDAAKMLAPALSFVGVVLVYFYTRLMRFSGILSFAVAALTVYSPVVISQIGSYYVDGLLGLMLLIFIFGYLCYERTKVNLFLVYPLLMTTLIPSVKFTGLVYLLILSIPVVLLIYKRVGLKYGLGLFLISGLAILLVCGNPYLSNYINNGYIFYPLNIIDIMHGQMTADYLSSNRFVKFIGSTYWVQGLEFRDWFKIGQTADLRVIGFGFTFGAVLIVTCINMVKAYGEVFDKAVLSIFIFTLLSVVVNPEMWWARYVPQLWLLPTISFFIFPLGRYLISIKVVLALMLIPIVLTVVNRVSMEVETSIDFYKKSNELRNKDAYIMTGQSVAANFLPAIYKRLDEIPVNIVNYRKVCEDKFDILFLSLCVDKVGK